MDNKEGVPCGPLDGNNSKTKLSSQNLKKGAPFVHPEKVSCLCEFRGCSALPRQTLGSRRHQKDWQPSHTFHGAHHIVIHLSEQRGRKKNLHCNHQCGRLWSRLKKNDKYLSQVNSENLIMCFIERDYYLHIIYLLLKFTVQYFPKIHDHFLSSINHAE